MGLRSLVSSIYVEPIMFIYMICLYYLIPATSSLYMYKVCRTVHNYSTDLCRDLVNAKITANNTAEEDVVSKGGSLWLFYQTICFTIPSTIVTLLLGLYGDRKGRKIPMILPCIGQGLGCLYYILMAKMDMLNVSYMVVGAFITGASGGFASIIMASFSHLSTTTSGADRTIRIVILQCIMGVGTALGSFTVGSLVNTPDDPIGGWVRTFGMITGLSMLCIVYILIRFHSPPRLHRSYDDISSSSMPSADPQGFASRINIVKVLSTVCQGFPSVLQLTLAAIWFAWVTGLGEFDVLFTYTQRMGLDRSIYGYYTGYGAIVQAIAGAVSVLLFKRFLDMSDSVLALIGLFSACLELLFLGLSGFFGGSSVSFQFLWWASPMAGMFKVIGPTSLRSIAAHLVNVRDQSKLFSFISASDGILQLVTSAVYNYLLWQMTEQHAPSASFFVSLALALIAVFITLAIRSILIRQRQSDTDDVAHIIDDSD